MLFQIANDLSKMQIDANVSEADVGTVENGQNVSFTVDAYPDRTFIGRVTQIRNSPVTVQNVVTYDTVIGVTNADFKLKPGMTATVSIMTAAAHQRVKNPERRPSVQAAGAVHQPDAGGAVAGQDRPGQGDQTRRDERRPGRQGRPAPTRSRRRGRPRRRSPATSRRRN